VVSKLFNGTDCENTVCNPAAKTDPSVETAFKVSFIVAFVGYNRNAVNKPLPRCICPQYVAGFPWKVSTLKKTGRQYS
jgi:hypothetical protein